MAIRTCWTRWWRPLFLYESAYELPGGPADQDVKTPVVTYRKGLFLEFGLGTYLFVSSKPCMENI